MATTDEMLRFSLYTASRATTQAYRELLEPWGLTYGQYLVLVVLWTEQELTVSALGDALQLDSGTLSPMLRRMEAAGLVRRTRDETDQRVVVISPTDRGRALRDELAHVPTCIASGTGLSSLAEARELIRSLQELTRTMRTVAAPDASGAPAGGSDRPRPDPMKEMP